MPQSNNQPEKRIRATQLLWWMVAVAAMLLVTAIIVPLWNRGPRASVTTSGTSSSELANEVEPASVEAIGIKNSPVDETGSDLSQSPQPSASALANLTEQQVQARTAQLMQLAMNDDAASLETILKEISNPNQAIRQGALEAAIQFGSRDAIPRLQQAAQDTTDANEKAQLLAAIDFLKLPSLTEVMLQKRSQATRLPTSVSLH